MRLKNYLLLISILLFTFTYLSAQTIKTVEQPEIPLTDPKKIIHVTSDQEEFSLVLKSNHSTGYSWAIKSYDGALIEPVNHHYVRPNVERPGASGYEIWTFKATKAFLTNPRATTIDMVYQRPWSKKVGKRLSFSVESK